MTWKSLFDGYWFVRVVLALWLVSGVFVLFLLGRIDWVVHDQLYDFGLQFSFVWATPYWSFLRLVYVCLAFPSVLSGVVLVFSFMKRGGGRRVVRREESKPSGAVQPLRENHMVVSCPGCKKVFSKPLVMLDFGGGKTRLVNVCPYCNHVLGSAEEEKGEDSDIGVLDLDREKEIRH